MAVRPIGELWKREIRINLLFALGILAITFSVLYITVRPYRAEIVFVGSALTLAGILASAYSHYANLKQVSDYHRRATENQEREMDRQRKLLALAYM